MKIIPLIGGGQAIVDSRDYRRLMRYKWRLTNCGYASRSSHRSMHREVLLTNSPAIDHINGNKLDNRRSNLRPCTYSQNQANRKIQHNNTSGYKGVYWSKKDRGWHVRVAAYGKRYSLGLHKSPELAAQAYNAKAFEMFGEFAKLNAIMLETVAAHAKM